MNGKNREIWHDPRKIVEIKKIVSLHGLRLTSGLLFFLCLLTQASSSERHQTIKEENHDFSTYQIPTLLTK